MSAALPCIGAFTAFRSAALKTTEFLSQKKLTDLHLYFIQNNIYLDLDKKLQSQTNNLLQI